MKTLGKLSERFESNGKPGAIGFDNVGGFSYGLYQIAANPGTMDAFLDFLAENHPDMAQALQDAGGPAGARAGTPEFKDSWKALAAGSPADFTQAQHDFIEKTHYAVHARKLLQNFSLDLDQRSHALRDVVWSMAVQHGNGTQKIFENALVGLDASDLSDEDLIRALYQERSKVDKYFAHSGDAVKQAVKARYQQEVQDALKMLAADQSQVTATGE